MQTLMSGFRPEVVVHTAASYKDPNDWHSDTMTNCVGGAAIASLAKEFGVGRIIYYQTALCYGLKPLENPITLAHPRNPAGSSYAISKTANELYIEESNVDYVTFRLANVIGPRNVAGPLPIFYQRLKDQKKCFITKARRDFVFVKDLARVTLQAIDGSGHGAYHFSSGKDVAIQELYDAVVSTMDLPTYPEPEIKDLAADDVASILLDPSRTFADFGAIEFTPLTETVRQGILYYQQHGTLGEYTHLKIDRQKA
jgi:nucleoside-diphosphate-sugar epimerase